MLDDTAAYKKIDDDKKANKALGRSQKTCGSCTRKRLCCSTILVVVILFIVMIISLTSASNW